jgi:glutathionyl-hydroquinone reductase
VVCSESYGIIEFLNSGFNGSGPDLCPVELKREMKRWNEVIYPKVNNGVYRFLKILYTVEMNIFIETRKQKMLI